MNRVASVPSSRPGSTRARKRAGKERGPYTPDATRQAIIDSALKLFEANGFHATSVQAVADEAGVTKGAFYHHFESKEELVHIIHDEFVDYQLGEIREILAQEDDPIEQLRRVIRMSVLSTVRFRSHVTVYFQERRYLQGHRFDAVKAKRDEITRSTIGIVEAGMKAGSMRSDADAHISTFGIIGMTAWSYQWLRESGRLAPEVVADHLAAMVLDGLRTH
jgi:AcrR family transcriptional regulator